jgi:Isochorismatase family
MSIYLLNSVFLGVIVNREGQVAESVGLIGNLKAVVKTIREKSIQVFIVPRHRWEPGDYQRWKHVNPSQIASDEMQVCAKGSWGGEWRPEFAPQAGDVVVIALAPAEDFRRDSDLFAEGVRHPEAQSRIQAALKRGFQTRDAEMDLAWLLGDLADR